MVALPSWMALRDSPLTPDQLVEAASATHLDIALLSGGSTSSRLTCVRSDAGWGIDIMEVNAHVRAVGALNPGCVALLVVERPGDSHICGTFVDRPVALVMPAGAEIAAGIKPGLGYTAVVLPAQHWRDALEAAGAAMPLAPLAVDLAPGAAAALLREGRRVARHLAAQQATDPGRVPAALIDYATAFATACRLDRSSDAADSCRTRLRQAWAAHDYLRDHLADDVTTAQLCRVLGISRRQLEYAFRTVFDVSPRAFQQTLRLNESRRRLLAARDRGQTVTQVATEVGVSHLGRYAIYYRRLFGETPRQTLERGGRA